VLTTARTVGHIELIALLDGARDLTGPIGQSFPDIPEDALRAHEQRAPGIYGERGAWRLHVRAWLVRHPGGVLLVDTGIGERGAPAPSWFGAPGALHEALRETGTPPDAIDTVVLTHVHDDHLGGTVVFADDGTSTPAFPRATYLLQLADREWQAELAADEDEDRVIDELLLRPLEASGQLVVVDGDHPVAEGVELRSVPGHTPGHQIVRLRSRGSRAIITADTFNHPLQLAHPDWASATDDVPARAAAGRRAVLAEALSHPGTVLAPTHFAEPFGTVGTGDEGLAAWTPLTG
jgi:glyoxylase-like metal-dependent hydrolase (beta-lactamase superfamily II)